MLSPGFSLLFWVAYRCCVDADPPGGALSRVASQGALLEDMARRDAERPPGEEGARMGAQGRLV